MTRPKVLLLITRITVLLAVVGALAVLTTQMSDLSGRIQLQQNLLAQSLKAQTHNRAVNVAHWCAAINNDRRILVRYVAAAHARNPGVVPLNLPQLPCLKIEKATAASTRVP